MALSYISEHFTLEEMYKSDVALRHGIDNTPPAEIAGRLRLLAERILEPVRAHFGRPFVPNSAYRCPALNTLVKGSATSQHMTGEAADIEIRAIANYDLAQWISLNLDFDQLILEFYQPGQPESGWVHCSVRSGPNRREALTFDGKTFQRSLVA